MESQETVESLDVSSLAKITSEWEYYGSSCPFIVVPEVKTSNFDLCGINPTRSHNSIASFLEGSHSLQFHSIHLSFRPCTIKNINIVCCHPFPSPKTVIFKFTSSDLKQITVKCEFPKQNQFQYSFPCYVSNMISCDIECVESWIEKNHYNKFCEFSSIQFLQVQGGGSHDSLTLSRSQFVQFNRPDEHLETKLHYIKEAKEMEINYAEIPLTHPMFASIDFSGICSHYIGPSSLICFYLCLEHGDHFGFYDVSIPLSFPQDISFLVISSTLASLKSKFLPQTSNPPQDLDIIIHLESGETILRCFHLEIPKKNHFCFKLPIHFPNVVKIVLQCRSSWMGMKWCSISSLKVMLSEDAARMAKESLVKYHEKRVKCADIGTLISRRVIDKLFPPFPYVSPRLCKIDMSNVQGVYSCGYEECGIDDLRACLQGNHDHVFSFYSMTIPFHFPQDIASLYVCVVIGYVAYGDEDYGSHPRYFDVLFHTSDGKTVKKEYTIEDDQDDVEVGSWYIFPVGVKNVIRCEIVSKESWESTVYSVFKSIQLELEEEFAKPFIEKYEENQSQRLRNAQATKYLGIGSSCPIPSATISLAEIDISKITMASSRYDNSTPPTPSKMRILTQMFSFSPNYHVPSLFSFSIPLSHPQHLESVFFATHKHSIFCQSSFPFGCAKYVRFRFHVMGGIFVEKEYYFDLDMSKFDRGKGVWFSARIGIKDVVRCELVNCESWSGTEWCSFNNILFVSNPSIDFEDPQIIQAREIQRLSQQSSEIWDGTLKKEEEEK
ncbi:hypothetical protein ADUPG1_010642 [Aduncisulcus paluster]|uniref:Uncharacterized protein n=1 Tax=Aduncisulcus paluster TaxID=2918883 RepID=A0ABQ5JWC5_9EUKA|nr:hypothetical protein ADUPG1_010642 [Aduncisulcus paluster]